MNAFNKCLVLLELLVQLLSVGSYTVVLKQVKPYSPPVKVYRYELRHPKIISDGNTQYIYHRPFLGQRIYPVAVKPGREANFKTRVPAKKEKLHNYKVSSTEKPVLKDSRLLGLSQSLVPPVSNQIEEYSEAQEEESLRILPTYSPTEKSFPSFGQEKGKIYNNPGDWATPAPQATLENSKKEEFTPSQLYLQIRHKNTVIHVPQSEALKDAETLEELINAPRLKELSRTTHVQETYSEEGYEDAGYDHAGHIRQAQHGEVYDAKDEGRFKIKEAPIILDYDSDLEESKKVPLKSANAHENNPADGNFSNKLEPRITRSRSEISKTSVEYAKIPKNYKGEHKYSSKVKNPVKIINENKSPYNATTVKEFSDVEATFPSYFGEMPPTPESAFANDSDISYKPSGKKSSKYRKSDFNSTKIYPVSEIISTNPSVQINEYTDFKPYMSLIDSQASPSTKSLKYSRIYSKKTKQLRLEPYKNENIFSPPPSPPVFPEAPLHEDLKPPRLSEEIKEEPINQRIVLPTIGYINSLTTAHFGKESSKPPKDESKPQLTDALNLTQALNYLRTNKNQQKNQETTKSPTEIDIRTFEPMKIKTLRPDPHSFVNKIKRDVYLVKQKEKEKEIDEEREKYEGNDESDLPHDEKNDEIAEDERKRIEDENREKEEYEAELKQEISDQEKEILKETFKNLGVKEDISEVFPESFLNSESEFSSVPLETTPTPVNFKKYPFYLSKRLPENSALRYATDPRQFPKKSGHKMEFYESRDRLIQCPDFHPDLDDLPDSNSTDYSEHPAGDQPRITRVGDKIACLRMKYFDPEPFDNPIFKEKEIDYVGKPSKNQKKAQFKIAPKTTRTDENDQKLQQTTHHKSYAAKPKEQKQNEKSFKVTQSVNNVNQSNPPFFHPSEFNITEKVRIIPVTEVLDDVPPHRTRQKVPNPNIAFGWKTTYFSQYPLVRAKPSETKIKLVKHHNCLPLLSKLADLDGTKNITIDCNDVIIIQEVIKNVARLRIIPKEGNKNKKVIKKKWSEKIPSQQYSDQTDWVPIAGYSLPKHLNRLQKPLSRRTDEVTKLKKETSQNASSTQYVIDELKEDENVRKGEVVEDMDHYLKMMEDLRDETTEATIAVTETETKNSTRRRRQVQNSPAKPKAQNNFAKRLEFSFDKAARTGSKSESEKSIDVGNINVSKPFELKRPLKRLSGIDFLIRYHKNKGKPSAQKVEDFWKVSSVINKNAQKLQKKSIEVPKPARPTSKNKEDKSDKTTFETTTEKYNVKENSDVTKEPINSTVERYNRSKSKQTNDSRKFLPLNLIPEKITKKPEGQYEFWKTSTQNSVNEKTTIKPLSFTKIVTKVSRETSESSEKPRIVYKSVFSTQDSSIESTTVKITASKQEALQYKTVNRSLDFVNDSENFSSSTENTEGGPTLYYVVNLKTGRGKWITNYNEQNRRSSGKYRKPQKLKESSDTKREKRRKKPKY